MALNTFTLLRSAVSNWLKRDTAAVSDDRLLEFVTLAEDRIYTDLRVRSMEASITVILKSSINIETVSGSNTVTLTPDTAATSYALGDRYNFDVATTNTAAVDVNISALGNQNVFKGEFLTDELEANDWVVGDRVEIVYDGTNFLWVPRGGYPLPSRYIEQRRIFLDRDEGKALHFFPPEQFWSRRATTTTGPPQMYTIEGPHIIFGPLMDSTYFGKFLYFRMFPALSADADTNWILTNAPGIYLFAALTEAHIFLQNQTSALAFAAMYQERMDSHNEVFKQSRFPRGRRAMRSEVQVA